MAVLRTLLALGLLLGASQVGAEPAHVLRIGTLAPEGTGWAREFKAFARDIAGATDGQVEIKWYLGGIAGDEAEMFDHIRRQQLDGAASAGALCERLAPSMRALRVLGLMTNFQETWHVLSQLRPQLLAEFKRSGFESLLLVPFGPHILFSRAPVRDFEDLRKGRFWIWDQDDVLLLEAPELGLKAVPLPPNQAGAAYEAGRLDGFISPPSVALSFQWSAQARYVTNLPLDMISGCLVLADRAFDALSVDQRKALSAAAAKLAVRFGDLGEHVDAALLGGLFARQGVETVPVSTKLRADFYNAARAARDHLGEKIATAELLRKILATLADYRAEYNR